MKLAVANGTPVIRSAKQAAPTTDWTILDAPLGTACPMIQTARDCDCVSLVTEPTPSDVHDLVRLQVLARHFEIPAFVGVNWHDLKPPLTAQTERRAAEFGATLAGRIPYDPAVTAGQRRGRPVLEHDPKSPAAQALIQLWRDIPAAFTKSECDNSRAISAR